MIDNGNEASTKHRSPAYPGFGLRTAVAKARQFYEAQKRNSVHVDVATETIGYKVKSGSGLRAVAALISFGLFEETGSGENRKVKLTQLAIKILLMAEDDTDRANAIREAALKPTIYAEMLKHWPDGLPNDAAINKFLTFEKNFNPEIVHLLIREFKDTYEYANLASHGIMSESDEDTDGILDGSANDGNGAENDLFSIPSAAGFGRAGAGAANMTPPREPGSRTLSLAITGNKTALLNLPADISEDDLKLLQIHLQILKATLTGQVGNLGSDVEKELSQMA